MCAVPKSAVFWSNSHLSLFLLTSGFPQGIWVLFLEHLPLSESLLFLLSTVYLVPSPSIDTYLLFLLLLIHSTIPGTAIFDRSAVCPCRQYSTLTNTAWQTKKKSENMSNISKLFCFSFISVRGQFKSESRTSEHPSILRRIFGPDRIERRIRLAAPAEGSTCSWLQCGCRLKHGALSTYCGASAIDSAKRAHANRSAHYV